MRIQRIQIQSWRHFEKLEIHIPAEAPLICLVGSNGTGKSQILEVIAAAAEVVGLARGFESNRGNPFDENGYIEVEFYLAKNVVPYLEEHGNHGLFGEAFSQWNRKITVTKNSTEKKIYAGDFLNKDSEDLGSHISQLIRNAASVHYLILDADRSYPRIDVNIHEIGNALGTDWENSRRDRSYTSTKSLYSEWFRFLIGTESQANNKHVAAIRAARASGEPEPEFVDKMKDYSESIKKVLPHLIFNGVNSETRQVLFDSTGVKLSFDQLSGGEREIAFLIGQIERFGLKKGFLLLDEPELHLNYDLLRQWIGYLKNTVESGQIWLATHSLEVVEVAGQDATFLIERDEATRKVSTCAPLSDRPIVSTLSRTIGSPAFSTKKLTFIFVEGEEFIGERERFRRLCSAPKDVRFLEAGNCREVVRRIEYLKGIAIETHEMIKVGGVIDQDSRPETEREALWSNRVYMLKVHEVENLLLHPPTMHHLLSSLSCDPKIYDSVLLAACDARAGSWVFDAARTNKKFETYPPPDSAVRSLVHRLAWADLSNPKSAAHAMCEAYGSLNGDQKSQLAVYLEKYIQLYKRIRESDDLWRRCEGKEVFRAITTSIGFADSEILERAIAGIWEKRPELRPAELVDLQVHIEALQN